MATNNTDTRILEIQVKYDAAIGQIAKYRTEIDQLREKQKTLKKEHKDGTIQEQDYQRQMEATRVAINTNSNAIGVLSRQIRNQINQEKEQEGSLKKLRAALSQATAEYDAMSRKERESVKGMALRDKINSITTELKSAEEATSRFYRNVGNYKSAVEGLNQIESKAKSLGKTLLGVFGLVSFGKFARDAASVGMGFEDQMAKVRAVTNATDEEFKMMEEEVRRLGRSTRYTGQEAGEAMENLTRNGMTAAQATGTLEGVLHLAQANAIGLGESADIVTGQLNSFHFSVSQVNRVNDVLSWTCSNSATDITQLAGALRNTSPIAYTLGISIEELNAAMGALADTSIKGEDAGTKMKQVFTGLASQTKKSKEIFKKYNLTISETMLKEEGLSAALHQLKDSGIMESGHAVDELGRIFGRQAAPSAMALINSLDKMDAKFASMGASGMIRSLADQTEEAATALEKYGVNVDMAAIKSDDSKTKAEELKRVMQELKANGIMESAEASKELAAIFGEDLTNSAVAYMNALEALDGKFDVYDKTEMIAYMAEHTDEAAAALERYGVQADVANMTNEELLRVFNELNEKGITKSATALQDLSAIVGEDLAPAALAAMQNINGLDAVFEGIDGTADRMFEQSYSEVSNKVAGLKSAWEDFEISIYKAGSGQSIPLLDTLTEGLQWASQNIESFMTTVMNIIASFSLAKIITHVKTSGATMKNSIIANAEAATTKVNNLAQQELKQRQNVEQLKMQAERASGTERQLLEQKLIVQKGQLAETEKAMESAKLAEMKAMQQAAAVTTATGWKGAMTTATIAVQGFVNASKAALKSFALTAILMVAIEVIQKLWGLLGDGNGIFSGIGKTISNFCKTALQGLINAVQYVVNWFVELYNDAIYVRIQVKAIGTIFSAVWAILKAGIKQIGNAFKLLGGIIGAVANALSGLLTLNWDKAKAGIKQLGTAVTDFFSNSWDNVKSAGKEIADDVVDSFNSINDKIEPITIKAKEEKTSPKGDGKTAGSPIITDTETPDVDPSGGTGDGKTNKKKDQADKQAKLELEAMQRLQQELWKLVKDGAEKRRQEVELNYDKEIAKLRLKLQTEKNLTATARGAINQTILALEQQRTEALEKLSWEETKKIVQEYISINDQKMKLVIKGSEEELSIKLDTLARSYDIAVQEKLQAIKIEEEKQEYLRQLREKAAQEGNEEEVARLDQEIELQAAAITRRNTELDLLAEQHERDVQAANDQHWSDQQAKLKEQAQLQIQEMEMEEQERLLRRNSYRDLDDEEYEARMQKQLESIGGFQSEKLRMEEEEAQRAYEALMERGQLTTQTEEEWLAEQNQAKQNWLIKQQAINDAYVKNEEAKYNAVKSVTNGLTSLLDVIGESNSAFAKMSKVVTLAQIAIDTGKAMSAGIASASAMPFPANIAAIATTVGTILANIATAISTVKSAKFATGGKVVGAGTGTSDSIPAMLSNGEFVMTARATSLYEPLLMAMNAIGSGVPMQVASSYERVIDNESLSESFEIAAREIKPIVSVVEITEMQKRVSTIENLDTY